ncbi:MAG: hypothetical protein AB1744_05080, partial [Candidatus Zixiibacteriota bacterium]
MIRYRVNIALTAAFVLLILSAVPAGGQEKDPLTVYAGVVTHPNPAYDSVALVDFPFSLNRHELSFYRQDSLGTEWFAYVYAQVDVFDTAGLTIDSVSTYFSVRAGSKEEAAQEGFRIFNRLVLMLKPGSYSARLTVYDVAAKCKGEFFIDDFLVEPIRQDRVVLGGLCLAYQLRYVGADSA